MLTDSDIEMVKETRREVYANRTHEITIIIPQEDEKDPISGEIIEGETIEHVCEAIVTEIASSMQYDRYLDNGILFEKGDVLFHIDYEELPTVTEENLTSFAGVYAGTVVTEIVNSFTEIKYRGKDYEVINSAHKGLGRLNRVEILGRVIS